MLLFNRDSLWPKAAVTLLLMAASTLLYAAKPYNVAISGDPTSCTISPAVSTITQGQTVLFSPSVSGFKGKKEYSWTFDHGSPASSTDRSVSVTYNAEGDFNVSLTVSSSRVAPATCSATVHVDPVAVNQPPTANANGPYTGTAGAPVSFSSAGSSDSDEGISG